MKSRKKRLEMIRELESSEFSRMISFRCSPDLWAKAKAFATHQDIAPAEHLQLCLAYHAELHRRNLDEKASKSLRDLKAKGKEIQP